MNGERSVLERRYARLLRAYPADYRVERGAEIVGTYLDMTGPARRWPSPADAVDLLGGGLRQRLRAAGSLGLLAGLPLAATLALTTATVLAVIWLGAVEIAPIEADFVYHPFGPFYSPMSVVWLGWLAAAVAVAVGPSRLARGAVAVAVVLTLAVVPVSVLTGYFRAPLYLLAPQVALGLVALFLPGEHRPWASLVPLLAAALTTVAVATWIGGPGSPVYGYLTYAKPFLVMAAVTLTAVAVLCAIAYGLRRDSRGFWAILVLLAPASLLAINPLAQTFAEAAGTYHAGWSMLVGTAVAVTGLGMAALPLTVALHGRRRPARVSTVHDSPTDSR